MKNKILLLIIITAISSFSRAEKVDFINNDWNKGREQAAKERKYLFVDAYTDWCVWCKVMDKETFPDTAVTTFMQQHFVGLKMDMEHNYGLLVGMKYMVTGYPTYLVFSPDGKLVYTIVGYQPAKDFLASLQKAVDPAKQNLSPGISDKVELDFPGFFKKSFGPKGSRIAVDSLVLLQYLDAQTETDLLNEVNRCVLEKFFNKLSPKYHEYFLKNHEKYAQLYGTDQVQNILTGVAHEKLQKAIDDKSEAGLQSAIAYAKNIYPQFDSSTAEYYSMTYYMGVGDWQKFAPLMDQYARRDVIAGGLNINSWCWSIYEKTDDPFIISKAIGWIKPVIGPKTEYAIMDTYAALLYKGKKLDEAEKYAQEAIDRGKKSGDNTKTTEQLLEKIKAEKKSGSSRN